MTETTAADAALAGGASHIGLVFFAPSPRYIAPDRAHALVRHISRRAIIVGLFVDATPAEIDAIRQQVPLDAIQLHGAETPAQVAALRSKLGMELWKAIPIRTSADLLDAQQYRGGADFLLYDAMPPSGSALPGGTGFRFDWSILRDARHGGPWGLAGGLTPANVGEAIRTTNAPLLDVSSGIESSRGVKDVDKIAAFLQAVHQHDQ